MANMEILNNVISTVTENTRKPEQFLEVQDNVALNFKKSIKQLYDFTKEQSNRKTNALPELVTDGFDEEQIWQQLELQNEGELDYFLNRVSRVLAISKELSVPVTPVKPELKPVQEEHDEEDSVKSKEDEDDNDSNKKLFGTKSKSILKYEKQMSKRKKKPSIVDDKFFKLQELDEYLTKEDKKEVQQDQKEDTSDEESVDLFADYSEEDEEDEGGEGGEGGEGKVMKYADFFDSPQSEDEANTTKDSIHQEDEEFNDDEELDNEEFEDEDEDDDKSLHLSDKEDAMDVDDEDQLLKSSSKKVKFNLTNDSDDTDSIEKVDSQKQEGEPKSTLELRHERLQQKIKELEEAAISEKPWQLKGEISGSSRPQNSLLEEFVEFDITTRPAPVITEKTTVKLEDIIKQRIKDKAWDDVEKKFKPVETPMEYKKKLILDQEKSKESLSKIYENEYLKQKNSLNPESTEIEEEEPQLHKEIREGIHSLFSKLDALSNFHCTPRQAKPELKVISNLPAINMEEVAPVATSDAAMLAPEEIKAKPRGELIGKAERTKTDMKRDRRHKKMRQRSRQQEQEKREKLNALKPSIEKKYKKDKAAALMKKLTNDRNISKLDETTHKVAKSSTAFFNQLQDQVKSHIKSKVAATSNKKQKNALSAVKLKL